MVIANNEYVGSPGIAEHTDHPGFGPAIATVSLLADAPRPRLPTAQPARRLSRLAPASR